MSGRNIPDENKPFIKLRAAAAFVRYLFVQFIENKGMLNASALTYTTLFAVVPLMTVTYAMLAIVSPFQGLVRNCKAGFSITLYRQPAMWCRNI
ncbi:hypothetical protein [Aliamphritea spongicola]|nr:hypothetical protein [Aliamphritea spongicola]